VSDFNGPSDPLVEPAYINRWRTLYVLSGRGSKVIAGPLYFCGGGHYAKPDRFHRDDTRGQLHKAWCIDCLLARKGQRQSRRLRHT
jgi:hypothetical protein